MTTAGLLALFGAASRLAICTAVSSVGGNVAASQHDDAPTLNWSRYALYRPTVATSWVVDATSSSETLKYNHDASVAELDGVWLVVWNGNTVPREGAPGQFNFMSTSDDLVSWSAPQPAFSSPERADNPVPCGNATCVQWQPNLFTMANGSLGCVWSGSNGRDGRPDANAGGTYLSTLDSPSGKWSNRIITFADNGGSPHPAALGKNWTLFATQNPYTLRSGRVLAPVVMTDESGAAAPGAPAGCRNGTFKWCVERRSSVLVSDDNGASWRCSPGTSIPGELWANWEPTVWQSEATDDVFMISRYNDFRNEAQGGPPADQRMRWARSIDGGLTWSALEGVPVDTVVSRAEVLPQSATLGQHAGAGSSSGSSSTGGGVVRWLMVENDWNPGDVTGTAGRLNVALWAATPSRGPPAPGSAVAFAPGVGLSATQLPAMYPQAWQGGPGGGTLAVAWSAGTSPRGIQVARLDVPPPDRPVVSVRNNSSAQLSQRPAAGGPAWLAFFGSQLLVTASPLRFPLAARRFSFGAWAKVSASGGTQSLLDARASADAGLLVGLHTACPFLFLGLHAPFGSTDNIEPSPSSAVANLSSAAVCGGSWVYYGLTVDVDAGTARFFVAEGSTGRSAATTVPFHPLPANQSLGSAPFNATVGNRNNPPETHSSVGGLSGGLSVLAVFEGVWTDATHAAFATASGAAVGALPVHPPGDSTGTFGGGRRQGQDATDPASVGGGGDDARGDDGGGGRRGGSRRGGGRRGGGRRGGGRRGSPASGWGTPVLELNASNTTALSVDFPTPPDCPGLPRPSSDAAGTKLTLCGHSSASVEVPAVSCNASGPPLRLSSRVTLQPLARPGAPPPPAGGCPGPAGGESRWTLFTVGDAAAHTRVVARAPSALSSPGEAVTVYLHCSVDNRTSAPLPLAGARIGEPIDVSAVHGAAGLSVAGQAPFPCGCAMGGVWLFAGEGFVLRRYSDAAPYATACATHDVAALATSAGAVAAAAVVAAVP